LVAIFRWRGEGDLRVARDVEHRRAAEEVVGEAPASVDDARSMTTPMLPPAAPSGSTTIVPDARLN
jgi:hypothetical protein